ncbi:hypothetical protein HG535_0F02450 [Zygotorulaspora mrakii]|uniref:ABC transporter domain-containing protein n=1 Tax=Zygotorulaspora mrakii TaxID=42260 RepID=A0A7H9B5U5_ZYGMR|nr:uncharacterized protein HG535_0F02450 [Zygotorulaspora mrakii]QLG73734.1 hypothetical protein HG535_0F02450 [Zygotorulaspora mrakii]
MSFSKYFRSIPDCSVTFDGASIRLDQNHFINNHSEDFDIENSAKHGTFLNDLVFRAVGGEMVLVLGKSSSSFFKALFENHDRMSYFPEGSIRFKDNEYKSFSTKCPQHIIYNNEDDIHFPTLTVKQTVDFALDCKFSLSKSERDELRDALLEELGLANVADTRVGDEAIRGISGGERKRISILETFIANGSFYLWDNSTKGLDSSTALEFLNTLKRLTQTTKSVNFVKISQASDKIVQKFDKILLLSESYQVFYGTVEECLEYFTCTLEIPKDPNLCVIEYLTSILNFRPESTEHGMKMTLPHFQVMTPNFEEYLHQKWIVSCNHDNWKHITSRQIEEGCDRFNDDDLTPLFDTTRCTQIRCCTRRAFQRLLGDKGFIFAQVVSAVVEALVTGSLFYDIPLTTLGSFSKGSLTFFAVLFFTFMALADIPDTFQRQMVVNKQVKLHFYSRWIEAFGNTIHDYVFKLIIVILFTIILYFLAHFQADAARFFTFLLFLSIFNFTMVSLFSFIAFITPNISIANSVAGIVLLAIAMYASYVIYIQDMHPWFVWIAYINPAMFAMEAILSNELFNLQLDCSEMIVPRGLNYSDVPFSHKTCAWQGATLGRSFVYGKDYLKQALNYTYGHVWRNFGILLGFLAFLLVISLLAAEYVPPLFNKMTDYEILGRFHDYNAARKSSRGYMVQDERPDHSSSSSIDLFMSQKNIISKSDECMETGTYVESQNHVFSWSNIEYTVNGMKLIDGNSGFVATGMTALMGESGAGKTTLLNIFSRMTKSGVVSGQFLIDGKPLENLTAFSRSIGFVQQQDVHLDLLTVLESLEVSCVLRGDGDKSYINVISDLLKLNPNVLVRDLTPTDRKLLSIGVELVTKPSLLLLLDEPTSGLDSQAAMTVVKFLKKLSLQGQAILCTIHQPSKAIYSQFDNIMLLKSGGKCVYFGPAQSAARFFLKYDETLTFDGESDNPADFVIDVVGHNGGIKEEEENTGGKVMNWPQIWNDSLENEIVSEKRENLEQEALELSIDFTRSVRKEVSYTKQLLLITKRQYLCMKRDRAYVISKFALNGGAGLFVGFSFWNTKYNITGLKNATFLCFMSLCISSALINQVQNKALEAKGVYLTREASTNTYHWSIFLLAQLIVEIPLAIASSTLFFLCCYFCCGYSFAPHIAGVFYLNYIVFSLYYLTFGMWLIYSTPNLQTAAVIVAFLYSFTAEFCGVMQPYSLMPGFWKFMYRASPYTYFVENFVSLLLHERPVICKPMEVVPTMPPLGETCGEFMQDFVDEFGGKMVNPNSTSICAYCAYAIGDEFLKDQFMSYSHIWRNSGIELAFIGFNVAAMFAGFYVIYVRTGWISTTKNFLQKLLCSKYVKKHVNSY